MTGASETCAKRIDLWASDRSASRRGRRAFDFECIDLRSGEPKYAATAGQRLIVGAGLVAEIVEPILRTQAGRPLADLDRRGVWRETNVNDDVFGVHLSLR